MSQHPDPAPLPPPRQIACQQCGMTFTCTPGACWCDDVPVRLPIPASGDCLCPDCLGRIAAEAPPTA